jgi:hypothetical protein
VWASAQGGPGRLRPWIEKWGGGPSKKENPFSFYFSIKTAQKCYFEQVRRIFKA